MISIRNVTFSYSGTGQGKIEDINLDIEKGSCVLLCGRSGCGKTTITRLINGLIPYFYEGELSGSVEVDGMEISKTPMYQIAEKVGSVFKILVHSSSIQIQTVRLRLNGKSGVAFRKNAAEGKGKR